MSFYKSDLFKNEVRQWELIAQSNLTPEVLARHFFAFNDKFGPRTLYGSPIVQLVRKSYVAAMYAKKEKASMVTMTPATVRSHDCEVKINGQVHKLKIVEVMANGRRRGDEYKNNSKNELREITDEQMTINFIKGLESLRSVLNKKSLNHRSNIMKLLVYYNVADFEEDETFLPAIEEIIKSVDHGFKSIEILRGEEVHSFRSAEPTLNITDAPKFLFGLLRFIDKLTEWIERLTEFLQWIGALFSDLRDQIETATNQRLNRVYELVENFLASGSIDGQDKSST